LSFADTKLIAGAGQGGLTAAARLKMLGVDALIVDSEVRIGDNWRQRYHQLVLHDPVWYDHMPYVSFPPHWPIFTPKDKLAEFLELYAKLLELNVWTETNLSASYMG
jgi:cation diffusion facilitator CzcD-associated flavoprotein CzcO